MVVRAVHPEVYPRWCIYRVLPYTRVVYIQGSPLYPGGYSPVYLPGTRVGIAQYASLVPWWYIPGWYTSYYTLLGTPSYLHCQRCTPGYTVTAVQGVRRRVPGLKKEIYPGYEAQRGFPAPNVWWLVGNSAQSPSASLRD